MEDGLLRGCVLAEGARGLGVSGNTQRLPCWSSFYEESRAWIPFRSVKKSWAAESDSTRCMRPWQCGQFHTVDVAMESTSAEGAWLSRAARHIFHLYSVDCRPSVGLPFQRRRQSKL